MHFVKTRKYGVVWHWADDLTWAQWFSLNIWPKFPALIGGLVGTLIASAISLVVLIVNGDAGNAGDTWSTLRVAIVATVGFVIAAIPTWLVRRCVANMQKSSNFRFGKMADGSPLLPTLVVLRHYNQLTVPLGSSLIERQWQINNWLRDTWQSDTELVEKLSNTWRPAGVGHIDRLRWLSLKERIASFAELPGIAGANGFEQKMNDLSKGLYGLAEGEAEHNLGLRVAMVAEAEADRDAASDELQELRSQAPKGA